MAGSVNKVILVGHLGRDPEIRTGGSGAKVANLRIATSENWRDKDTGERKERTEWHSVVIFNEGLVKIAEAYLRKGSKVYLEGALQTRKWTDQQGQERYSTEVVLARFRGEIVLLDKTERSAPDESDYGRTETKSERNVYADQRNSDKPFRPTDPGMDDEVPF